MKSLNIILLSCTILVACEKQTIVKDNVIQLEAPPNNTVNANGSKLEIFGLIPEKALEGKREISFKASQGKFEGGTDVIKVTAIDSLKNPGYLTAKVIYVSTLTENSKILITAQIDKYIDSLYISSVRVNPDGIKISADAFSVPINYLGSINLIAKLTTGNSSTTKGHIVVFKDVDANNVPLNGTFTSSSVATNDTSLARTRYTPGLTSANKFIFLKSIWLNANGQDSNVRDSIKIYLTPQ